jgi:RNA 3'-terminal phosphate cyclase (ATP)
VTEILQIDGSQGEGGGQIVRSALALSAVTGRPFELANIRSGRKNPGLLRQHLTAVNAAREICGAGVTGAELHSRRLIFAPGTVQTRGFRFAVGSAGSAILVAQTVLPALMFAVGNSSIEIEGGTHNMAAPPFEYLHEVYLPLLTRLGPQFESKIDSWGFYPMGGGRIRIAIRPSGELAGLQLMETGGAAIPAVTALVSKLPEQIGQRECQIIRHRTGWKLNQCQVRVIDRSPGPGNVVMIRLASPNVTEMFTAFGKRGVRAEQVATQALNQALGYLADEVPVGEYLCDQLLLPLALAARSGQTSQFLCGPLSMHSHTHIDILKLFLNIGIEIRSVGPRQQVVCIAPL